MKTKQYQNEDDWLDARRGKLTGTKLGNLIGKRDGKYKMGYYELLAEKIALPPTEENRMDRGKRLEDIAVERFIAETGKKVKNDLVMWFRDDNENIAVSPDGSIGKTECVEIKCLSTASHVKAWLTKEIPDDYEFQVLQYFIVNDKLKKLYFVFYDPRCPKDLFWLEVKRSDVQEKVVEYLAIEKQALAEIEKLETEFTF